MALVSRNNIIRNQTPEDFDFVFKSKMTSASNLDLVSRNDCPLLDHFLAFSSVTSGRGSPGTANYGMANSAMERLIEKRRIDGLSGLAIQWGPISEVGAYEKTEMNLMVCNAKIRQKFNHFD